MKALISFVDGEESKIEGATRFDVKEGVCQILKEKTVYVYPLQHVVEFCFEAEGQETVWTL